MLPLLLIQLSSTTQAFKYAWAANSNQIVGPIAPQPETH